MRQSVKHQLKRAFVYVVAAPLMLLAGLVMLWFILVLPGQARDAIGTRAQQVAALLDAHLSIHRHAIEELADSLSQKGLGASPTDHDSWLDRINGRYPGVMTMLIADARGEILSASPSGRLRPRLGQDFAISDRDYFRIPMARGGSYVSNVFQGRGFGADPIVAVSARLDDADGGPLGLVQASLNLNTIADLEDPMGGIPGSQMVVVDASGRVVASSDAERFPFLAPLTPDWTIADHCRVPIWQSCLTREARLREADWRVLVRQPPLLAFRPVLMLLGVVLAALAGSTLLAFAWSRSLYRLSLRPLEQLADTVSTALIGKPLDAPPVPSGAPTEVAVLSAAFGALFERLSEHELELQQRIHGLDEEARAAEDGFESQRQDIRDFIEDLPLLVVDWDAEGSIAFANRATCNALGYEANDLALMNIHDLIAEDGPQSSDLAEMLLELEDGERHDHMVLNLVGRVSHRVHVIGSIARLRDADGRLVTRAMLRDASSELEAQDRARQQSELLDLLLRHAPAQVALFDTGLRYLAASDRWLKAYHLSHDSIIGATLYESFPEMPPRWRRLHQRVLSGEVVTCDEDEASSEDAPIGGLRWEARPWHRADGKIGGMLMVTEVASREKRLRDQLKVTAEQDHLTGVLNRKAMLLRLGELCDLAVRRQQSAALLLVNLNDFKAINEAHGLEAADQILTAVAGRLKHATRQTDALGRLGSHEFGIALSDHDAENHIQQLRQRIVRQMEPPVRTGDLFVTVECSIGIAVIGPDQGAEDLLRGAQKKLLDA